MCRGILNKYLAIEMMKVETGVGLCYSFFF